MYNINSSGAQVRRVIAAGTFQEWRAAPRGAANVGIRLYNEIGQDMNGTLTTGTNVINVQTGEADASGTTPNVCRAYTDISGSPFTVVPGGMLPEITGTFKFLKIINGGTGPVTVVYSTDRPIEPVTAI